MVLGGEGTQHRITEILSTAATLCKSTGFFLSERAAREQKILLALGQRRYEEDAPSVLSVPRYLLRQR